MDSLKKTDPQIYELIEQEEKRQKEVLEMIPSENYASKAVIEALGSILTNKYSEGFPKKRYYQGNNVIDSIEITAQERAKKLFGVPYVNVQALSGSPANSAVYLAALENGEKIMGLSLAMGGHITHGHKLGLSGRLFTFAHYELGKDGFLDYSLIEKQVMKEKPKLLICGFTAYSRMIDFEKFAKIADKVGAYLMADISHITGLIIGGVHPSPVKHAHIVTTTTHKTLRGPRGALIMVTDKGLKKNPELPKKIELAIIPGLQGGPHDNQTAAIAVALLEASKPEFKRYAAQIVKNAKALAQVLTDDGFELVSGGTDNHLLLLDLRNKGVNGAIAAFALEVANIVTNKNLVLGDTMPPFYPSGVRLGTPAITSRGMKEDDMKKVGKFIARVINAVRDEQLPTNKDERSEYFSKLKKDLLHNKELLKIAAEVKSLTANFPIPGLK
ncbi:MAG: serine hydroxymethyltransferase [Candidatus Levybacteria bacterium RIFCSPHIGHO2_01_FULL_40_10]|nr:MAG: serine hydroxymethyltransferase [Candidatus Levybacteria bacterium RIFCSPHIGHO2_01_FULL_40_10]